MVVSLDAGASAVARMEDLAPSWDAATVASLLGKQLADPHAAPPPKAGTVLVWTIPGPVDPQRCDRLDAPLRTTNAQVVFASVREREETLRAYQGLPVPSTHGYHHYSFSSSTKTATTTTTTTTTSPRTTTSMKTSSSRITPTAIPTSAPSPPLHLQLLALPTIELERRLSILAAFGAHWLDPIHESTKTKTRGKKPKNKVKHHAQLTLEVGNLLLSILHTCDPGVGLAPPALLGQRPTKDVAGLPLEAHVTDPLLAYLRSPECEALWPPLAKQRKGVRSGRYLTVRRSHPPEQAFLWGLCADLIRSVADDGGGYDYTALAITRSFEGSPHVDAHDQTHQHVVALGDFTGGRLCAEDDLRLAGKPSPTNDEEEYATKKQTASKNVSSTLARSAGGGFQIPGGLVTRIDVRNRLGRLDGRRVHWVDAWEGERFSVVYYTTHSAHYAPPEPQAVHNAWMEDRQANLRPGGRPD